MNVVNSDGEGQTPISDSTTDIQTPEVSEETSSLQSREDNNTQADENNQNAEAEQLTDKSQNRFQQLANERDEYRSKFEESLEAQRRLEADMLAQAQRATINPNYQQGNYNNRVDPLNIVMQSQLQRLELKAQWQEALAEMPELKTDKQLDDLVYRNYVAAVNAGENVTPLEVAKEVKSWLRNYEKKVSKQAYSKAEDDITQKAQISRQPVQRSNTSNNQGGDERNKALSRYRETGDERALYDILDY